MHQRCRRYEAVTHGTRVWHMEAGAVLRNCGVDRQDAARKGG